ncbi:MAG: AMP-binding protein [Planctomycetes bacterium]|nr:AMP-binding protein [Planctomycetota bacterium]
MNLWRELEAAARAHAPRPAYAADPATDYAALHGRVQQHAAWFQAQGVQPGDRIAAFLVNGPELFELYLACAALGAILVPLNLRLAARELRFILEDASPLWLVRGDEAREALDEALAGYAGLDVLEVTPRGEGALAWCDARAAAEDFDAPELSADAVAHLYYTSGTTGRAKGVPLTHGNVLSHARAAIAELELTADDTWGHFAPMFHLADAWAVFAVSLAGGRHAFCPRFEPGAVWRQLADAGVTLTNLVPTMLGLLVHAPEVRPLPALRLVLSGGAPIAPELVRRVEAVFGCRYAQTYGLTETSPYLTISLPDARAADLAEEQRAEYVARTGRPFGGIELRVVDAEGRPVPADDATVGEIQARGPWVFGGYWNRPRETEAAFQDGWFRTGDLATLDARGSLRIVDRRKDVILTGGETVYSTEVENALYTHQLVREAAVVGLPDELWGEVVAAAVVRAPGADGRVLRAPELLAHCRLFLAGYKVPRRLAFFDELPKTGSGKLQKRIVRELLIDLPPERFEPESAREGGA